MEMNVDKENDDIMYNDEYHKYWTKEDNLSCISVTTLIHKFENFDVWELLHALSKVDLVQINEVEAKELKK